MAVTIAENEGKVWYEFGHHANRDQTYVAWIGPDDDEVRLINFSLEHKLPEVQLPYWYSQLEVPVTLFKRVVSRLENAKGPIKLGQYGTFEKSIERVFFTLPCGEEHTFDLEDLLTLADQF